MKYEDKPYVWFNSNRYPRKAYLEYNWRKEKTDQYIFMQAEPVLDKDYDLVLQCGADEEVFNKFDILENSTVAPIVNQKVLDLLADLCPNDYQSFPVSIINSSESNKYINRDYFLLNIVKEVDSIDRDSSYLRFIEGGAHIMGINKLYFKSGCMGDSHLAREKYYHPLELVSAKLVNEFKKRKIKGVRFFTDIEAYHRPFPEEYLTYIFPENPEAAKRAFVAELNTTESYEFFKTRIHKMPPEILEALIEMTLSRSSFHAEQCAELRVLLKQKS
jgi:hypothetical protein